jgi:hypothetical protein
MAIRERAVEAEDPGDLPLQLHTAGDAEGRASIERFPERPRRVVRAAPARVC